MARYRYKPLPKVPGTASIRLATIHPGVGNDDLVLDLHIETFTLQSSPRYEALSYVWGSTKARKVIYIGKSDKAALQVTRSLKTALFHLRYPRQKRVMWIDALCINQSDNIEKGAQVAMMGRLFACAAHVLVWLGPEANDSNMAMERLSYIGSQIDVDWGGIHRITPAADIEHVDRNIADPNFDLPMNMKQSNAVASLLNRHWFDRLWIRQEILVAEDKAFVCCGSHQMPWPVFRKALRLLYSKRPKPRNVIYLLKNRLMTIAGFIFQMRWTDVLSIRGIFDDALCSDPRDRIYGIRSLLLEDQQELCGEPNYTRSTVEVYSEFTRNYIKRYPNGLTILRQCELSQLSQRWSGPSWVPDWSTKAGFQSRHGTFASSQLQGHFAFPRTGTLQVLGISQTVVKEIQPVPKFYQRDWNEAVKFLRRITPPQSETTVYPPGGSLLRALARTMVCGAVSDFGHVRDGNFPTTQIAEAEMSRFVSGVDLVSEDYKIGSHAQRFLKRMDWGSGGKSFIIGTGGYVGVSPPSTRIGDDIFVIVGCQQPLVLRRCLNGANQYSVVGVCYVEGCARGEPLLGNLPDHIGFSWIEDTVRLGWSRRFENLWSGELFQEDPRLESLGVDLGEFRKRLSENPEATLNLAPEVLQKCIAGLQYIELI